jgi:hypothetical protein
MSTFEVHCARCGRSQAVAPSLAGTTLTCRCGHEQRVPALSELRREAGLVAYELSAAGAIQQLIREGRLPADQGCIRCGTLPAEGRTLIAVCERARTQSRSSSDGDGGGFWLIGLIGGLPFVLPFTTGAREQGTVEQLGRDLQVRVPVHVCSHCWRVLWRNPAVRLLHLATRLWLIGAAAVALLWLAEPYTGWTFSFSLIFLVLAAVAMTSLVERWSAARVTAAQKTTLKQVPAYRRLLEEYPEAELVERDYEPDGIEGDGL